MCRHVCVIYTYECEWYYSAKQRFLARTCHGKIVRFAGALYTINSHNTPTFVVFNVVTANESLAANCWAGTISNRFFIYTRHTSSCMCVGYALSLESLTYVSSSGLSRLPPSCSSNYLGYMIFIYLLIITAAETHSPYGHFCMAISIKTPEDIQKMRVAGRLAAEVLEIIEPHVKPGVTTGELDRICHDHITNHQQAISACLGYHGFPKSVCISVNEVICHGIPSDEKVLKDGDIVNIDVTVIKDGFHGDTSKMFIVGKPTILGERLCRVTQESLYLAIKMVKPGIRLRTLGKEIQKFVEAENFSVVREYCGHGIGEGFHEEPQVLHYDADDGGVVLQTGMAFTIEPMVNAGDYRIRTMKDGWTVKTKDRSLSAQYEHTIVVTDNGCEIMTLRKDDTIPNIITHE